VDGLEKIFCTEVGFDRPARGSSGFRRGGTDEGLALPQGAPGRTTRLLGTVRRCRGSAGLHGRPQSRPQKLAERSDVWAATSTRRVGCAVGTAAVDDFKARREVRRTYKFKSARGRTLATRRAAPCGGLDAYLTPVGAWREWARQEGRGAPRARPGAPPTARGGEEAATVTDAQPWCSTHPRRAPNARPARLEIRTKRPPKQPGGGFRQRSQMGPRLST